MFYTVSIILFNHTVSDTRRKEKQNWRKLSKNLFHFVNLSCNNQDYVLLYFHRNL